jgi:hypothetical protein
MEKLFIDPWVFPVVIIGKFHHHRQIAAPRKVLDQYRLLRNGPRKTPSTSQDDKGYIKQEIDRQASRTELEIQVTQVSVLFCYIVGVVPMLQFYSISF